MNTKQHIKTYSGIDGLLEITRNSLRAKGELLIFETSYASLNDMFSRDQADKIRIGLFKNNIKVRELTNRVYHEPYTEIEGFHEKMVDIRYIDPSKLNIEIETLVYNDVVAIYQPKKADICVEIYSKQLANQQRQLFEFVWKKADKPIIGKGGRTSIF